MKKQNNVGALSYGNTHKTDTNVSNQYSNKAGITLGALVITIIVLIILAGVSINLTLGPNGIFMLSRESAKEYNEQEAIEKINLKIINCQMHEYAENSRLPNLQELADAFCKDKEIEYVTKQKRVANLDKIELGEAKSFFTKLKEYPYEFEIDEQIKLASIDGKQLETSKETIPEGYIKPEGAIIIEANGNYDVKKFETAIVQNLYTKQQYEDNYDKGYNDNTGQGKYWNYGEVSAVSGRNKINIGFVPSKLVITNNSGLSLIYNSLISEENVYSAGTSTSDQPVWVFSLKDSTVDYVGQPRILSVASEAEFYSVAERTWYWFAVK